LTWYFTTRIRAFGKPVLDYFHNSTVVKEHGKYTTDLFSDKATQILKQNDEQDKPRKVVLPFFFNCCQNN